MKLPDTQNANYQYAFKKGYRHALDGKLLSAMPSQIRKDANMRGYYQQGWQSFQDDAANAKEEGEESPWRNRFAWFIMSIVAGIGTAALIIKDINQTRQQTTQILDPVEAIQQPKIEVIQTPTPSSASIISQAETNLVPDDTNVDLGLSLIEPSHKAQPALNDKSQAPLPQTIVQKKDLNANDDPVIESTPPITESLSLLSTAARNDLEISKTEFKNKKRNKLSDVIDSPIEIKVSVFTNQVIDREVQETYTDIVPKYIRKVYYFTQIEGAADQTLYHRWVYNGQIMATIPLEIKGSLYRTWSSKRLSSAWHGEWTVDILDAEKNTIHRDTFTYIK